MKIYTNITVYYHSVLCVDYSRRDIRAKKSEWEAEDEETGVTWFLPVENIICRGWTSVIYSRRTPEAAASPRELRNLRRLTEYFHHRGTIWQNFQPFWRINVGRKLFPFSLGQREIRMADAFYIRLETLRLIKREGFGVIFTNEKRNDPSNAYGSIVLFFYLSLFKNVFEFIFGK